MIRLRSRTIPKNFRFERVWFIFQEVRLLRNKANILFPLEGVEFFFCPYEFYCTVVKQDPRFRGDKLAPEKAGAAAFGIVVI